MKVITNYSLGPTNQEFGVGPNGEPLQYAPDNQVAVHNDYLDYLLWLDTDEGRQAIDEQRIKDA